jgi:hypothetical protein
VVLLATCLVEVPLEVASGASRLTAVTDLVSVRDIGREW